MQTDNDDQRNAGKPENDVACHVFLLMYDGRRNRNLVRRTGGIRFRRASRLCKAEQRIEMASRVRQMLPGFIPLQKHCALSGTPQLVLDIPKRLDELRNGFPNAVGHSHLASLDYPLNA